MYSIYKYINESKVDSKFQLGISLKLVSLSMCLSLYLQIFQLKVRLN